MMDNRLVSDTPSLRFRLTPRPGLFDDREATSGSVLEFWVDESGPSVGVRVWHDPLSETPSSQATIAAASLGSDWIDRMLVDFVGKTLSHA